VVEIDWAARDGVGDADPGEPWWGGGKPSRDLRTTRRPWRRPRASDHEEKELLGSAPGGSRKAIVRNRTKICKIMRVRLENRLHSIA
jgi:hypothetical protein